MTYEIYQGDCIASMRGLPAGSVQTCVTSPPYYGLRAYLAEGDEDKHLEIGTEETPEAYVAKLVDVFREVKRVLRNDGTLWLNLACSYNGSGGAGGDYSPGGLKEGQPKYPGRNLSNFKPKDMIPIPWMVAMALQQDGWYLRSDIIWAKNNPMPESVTDRPTKAHEYIFLLSKSSSYYYDADAIREENSPTSQMGRRFVGEKKSEHTGNGHSGLKVEDNTWNGRNKRSVWTVATQPYAGAHFATYPVKLIEPCILAGTSAHGCCADCGAPWARAVEVERSNYKASNYAVAAGNGAISGGVGKNFPDTTRVTTGWQPTCTCAADVVPCTVLDPFSGSGTTGAVALKYGRKYIGCELNPDYIKLAHERIAKSQPMLLDVTP